MNKNDDLGNRMKGYENISRYYLTKKTPVIIRIDGKAFHTFTRGFKRPFDDVLIKAMQETAQYLCKNITGCKLAYTQSDEISLLLVDYERNESQPWFANNLQKMCSVSASMATMAFSKAFSKAFDEWGRANLPDWDEGGTDKPVDENLLKLCKVYGNAEEKGAMFDARVFVIPKEEVCNYFIWRQQDASRNSIQMVAQSIFSEKELNRKNTKQQQEMIFQKTGINWNNYDTVYKRGSCCIKSETTTTCASEENGKVKTWTAERPHWFIDKDIPIFTQDRNYIDKYVFYEKE
jgi:tRNA(His) 5'-end guanylyltransferase